MHVSSEVTNSGGRKSNPNAISLPVKLAHGMPPVESVVKNGIDGGELDIGVAEASEHVWQLDFEQASG
jgi:hypothetical protein